MLNSATGAFTAFHGAIPAKLPVAIDPTKSAGLSDSLFPRFMHARGRGGFRSQRGHSRDRPAALAVSGAFFPVTAKKQGSQQQAAERVVFGHEAERF
jgi:hypothetical protein